MPYQLVGVSGDMQQPMPFAAKKLRTVNNGRDADIDFEDIPAPEVFDIGIYRDGVIPIEPSAP